MPTLAPPPAGLLAGAALFLDFDGTLVELAATPDAIKVDPALAPLLERISRRLEGRVAIVSGRSLADLERHLPLSGIGYSGSHGLELKLRSGATLPLSVPLGFDHVREAAHALAAEAAGLLVEDKPAGVAIHYRAAPELASRVRDFADVQAARNGLAVQPGNMVVELRAPGATKGDALRAFMSEPDFAAARPLFVGDDLTDEDGFAAAAGLGGAGILVGAERLTAARYRLDSVGAAAAWLRSAL